MNEQALLRLSLVFLMLAMFALLYLDWLRGGEIESIHARLDAFGRQLVVDAPPNEALRPIADTLRAKSNGELDARARENL